MILPGWRQEMDGRGEEGENEKSGLVYWTSGTDWHAGARTEGQADSKEERAGTPSEKERERLPWRVRDGASARAGKVGKRRSENGASTATILAQRTLPVER